jgi:hypothetical protein
MITENVTPGDILLMLSWAAAYYFYSKQARMEKAIGLRDSVFLTGKNNNNNST